VTSPTHAAFGFLLASLSGAPLLSAVASAFGALLPDIDHPQSVMGRLFFFLSQPLNSRFGHRNLIHSFIIWAPLFLAGVFIRSDTILWIALGAWSHILLDCWNISGTKAFIPFSQKPVVIFKRDWRILTGSVQEIIICFCLLGFIGLANYSYSLGGPRKLINLIVGSPAIMAEEYARAGNNICYVNGRFRWSDGHIEDVKNWLVVGTEKNKDIVFWNGSKIVRNYKHGAFLSAKLSERNQDWPAVIINGFAIVNQHSFFFDGEKWCYAQLGARALGRIKAVNLETPSISPSNYVQFNLSGEVNSSKPSRSGDENIVMCQYIRNYDGDTITVTIPSWPKLVGYEIGVRIAGIDTPELRGSSGETKEKALKAKKMVTDLCTSAELLFLRNITRGKYFRIVADVYADGINISNALLDAKLAIPYDGGTKPVWN